MQVNQTVTDNFLLPKFHKSEEMLIKVIEEYIYFLFKFYKQKKFTDL